ncbi:hypothetical protein ACLBWT_15495 [Paenibacillus sp. D51F]
MLDCTNPAAIEWMHVQLETLQREYGIDGFKLEAGDPDPGRFMAWVSLVEHLYHPRIRVRLTIRVSIRFERLDDDGR